MAGAPGAGSVVRRADAARGAALAGSAVKGAPSTGRAGASPRVAAARCTATWAAPPGPDGAVRAADPVRSGTRPARADSSAATTGWDSSTAGLDTPPTTSGVAPLRRPGTAATGRTVSNRGRRATVSGALTARGRTAR
ncbi:hypothetical protein ACFWXO_33795 [Kitasatospora sp. NPDC059088]|uniref:hypothetical protein n=1 Tax=Kitasatospora sp. NPDC059088 TaxID=3346722 RepID=UPI00367F0ABF